LTPFKIAAGRASTNMNTIDTLTKHELQGLVATILAEEFGVQWERIAATMNLKTAETARRQYIMFKNKYAEQINNTPTTEK